MLKVNNINTRTTLQTSKFEVVSDKWIFLEKKLWPQNWENRPSIGEF